MDLYPPSIMCWSLSPVEVFQKVDVITKEDVVNWANYRLNNKPISIAATGNVTFILSVKDVTKNLA